MVGEYSVFFIFLTTSLNDTKKENNSMIMFILYFNGKIHIFLSSKR